MSRVLVGMPRPSFRRGHCWLLVLSIAMLTGCAQMSKLPAKFMPKPPPTFEQRYTIARMFEEGRPEEARKIYLELLECFPEKQIVMHRLAVVAAKEGKYDEADHYFRMAWQAGPASVDLLCDMGYALYLQHRLPEAEAVFKDALAQAPRNPMVLNNLGLVVGQMGRYDESLSLFRQVNNEAEAEANLGYIMAQEGELAEAKKHLGRALTMDPKLESAAEALVQLKRREQLANDERKKKGLPAIGEEPDEIWIDGPSGAQAPATMQASYTPSAAPQPAAAQGNVAVSYVPQPHTAQPQAVTPAVAMVPSATMPGQGMIPAQAMPVQQATMIAPVAPAPQPAPTQARITGVR